MHSYACMLQTIDNTKDSFINRMMARNILQFRLYNSCNRKKIDLVQLKNLNVTLTVDARFFHFLVLLKNYDGRRLKHKLEFLCRQCCSYLAHIELILNFLESSISFHFSVQFLRLVISITDKRTMTIEAQYPNVFVILLLPLMSSLCRIVFRFYDYITREHTLTFEITFT